MFCDASVLLLLFSSFSTRKSKAAAFNESLATNSFALEPLLMNECEVLEIKSTGEFCEYYIWNEDGDLIYTTEILDSIYPTCLNSSECYSIAPFSTSDDCKLEFFFSGVQEVTSTTSVTVQYNPDNVGTVVRLGASDGVCTKNSCTKNKTELFIYNTADDGTSLNYTLETVSDATLSSGYIGNGDSKSICIDLTTCSILESEIGRSAYYFLIHNNTVIASKELNNLELFGNCPAKCNDLTFVIFATGNSVLYTMKEDSNKALVNENQIYYRNTSITCLKSSNCYTVAGSGSARFFLFKAGELLHTGNSLDNDISFGTCTCKNMPLLSSTERGKNIVLLLSTISGMEALSNYSSPQYNAACWLINYDSLQLPANAPNILQRYVLALFYYTTNGPGWKFNLGFLNGEYECQWKAVLCNNEGFVKELILTNNNLNGVLVREIYSLTYLEYIDLNFNSLSGTIPDGLERLRIKYFDIGDNDFSGQIPHDLFNIEGIAAIKIDRNSFTGSLPCLCDHVNDLETFTANHNYLHGTIPDWIGNATNLRELALDDNLFNGTIPPIISNMTQLKSLDLNSNAFTGTIPSSLFSLVDITFIDLSNNSFHGGIEFPSTFAGNPKLESVAFSRNNLNGTISQYFSLLPNLTSLTLSYNDFTGTFPNDLVHLERLEYLRLQNNFITGTIPFQNCDQFSILSADCDIPHNISCKCCDRCYGLFSTYNDDTKCAADVLTIQIFSTVIEFIDFSLLNIVNESLYEQSLRTRMNNHTSSICISITDCYNFISTSNAEDQDSIYIHIWLNNNPLPLFSNLSASTSVFFGYSQSNGTLLPNICDTFHVCGEKVTVGTPTRTLLNRITRFSNITYFQDTSSYQHMALCWWLTDLSSLTKVALENSALIQRYILALFYITANGDKWNVNRNWLSSSFSECAWYGISCNADVVKKISLPKNDIKGVLCTELGQLKGLEQLILERNSISGLLPSQLSNLKNLHELKLSNNFFDGNIPSEIDLLKKLTIMDLSFNMFTGSIPEELGGLEELVSLNLSDNSFSNEVPINISALANLKILLLSNNLFQGEVLVIRNLTNLERLDLSSNYFSGDLPIHGTNLNLTVVHFNSNLFSGSIPNVVGQLTNLSVLYLYNNDIRGSLPTEIGNLTKIKKLALSYNQIKGTIPQEVEKLRELQIFQLQSNQLEGDADYFDYDIPSFVTDCGNTATTAGLVDCDQCTECCNQDGDCISPADTWPKYVVMDVVSTGQTAFLLLLIGWIFMLCVAAVLVKLKDQLSLVDFRFDRYFQSYSVYRFFLTKDVLGWSIALTSVAFQMWVTYTFFKAGDDSLEVNDYVYSVSCPSDGVTCENMNQTTTVGWFTFAAIIAIFSARDTLDAFFIYYESCVARKTRIRGIFTGIIILSVPAMTIVASFFYLNAISLTNAELLQESVAILFLSDIDEQLWEIIHRISPKWIEKLEYSISNSYHKTSMSKTLSSTTSDVNGTKNSTKHEITKEGEGGGELVKVEESQICTLLRKSKTMPIPSELFGGENGIKDNSERKLKSSNTPTSEDIEKSDIFLTLEALASRVSTMKESFEVDNQFLRDELLVVREENTKLSAELERVKQKLKFFERK